LPGRFARPFHVKPCLRALKRATSRSFSTRRPCETWNTSTRTRRPLRCEKPIRTRLPRGRALAERKPFVAGHAVAPAGPPTCEVVARAEQSAPSMLQNSSQPV
jgi:hypothetical protein